MSLGFLLLQPQALERLNAMSPEDTLADDVIALVQRVALSPEQLADLGPPFMAAFEAMGQRLEQRVAPNLSRALDQLRQVLERLTGGVADFGARIAGVEDVASAFDVVAFVLERAAAAVQALTEAELRALFGELAGILGDTLGLSQRLLRDELERTFDDLRARLLAGNAALTPRAASTRQALVALLARLSAQVFPLWTEVDLSPDRLAQSAARALENAGIATLRDKVACILGKLRAALSASGALIDLARPGFGPGSAGAAAPRPVQPGDSYCWYASWLYGSRRRTFPGGTWWADTLWPGLPDDEVWLTADRRQLVLRRVFADDEVLHQVESGTINWYDAPQFSSASGTECFTFRGDAQNMEVFTQLLYALRDFAEGITHIVFFATRNKEYGANVPLFIWKWVRSLTNAFGAAPIGSLVANRAGWPVFGGWLMAWPTALSIIFGSIEGRHQQASGANQFYYWLTLLASDTLSALTVKFGAEYVSNGLLELGTLINYNGPGSAPSGTDTRPRNYEYSDTLIAFSGMLFDWVLTKHVIPREDYGFPFASGTRFYLWWLVGAPLSGCCSAILGTLVGWTFARTYDFGQFGTNIGKSAARSFISYTLGLTQYLNMEGDTNGGKYNPKTLPDGKDHAPPRQPFAGYPPKETSPYRLPWEAGAAKFLGQAHQGLFSHKGQSSPPRVYSFDFALDQGDEVLASRPGVVEAFFDWIPDDTHPDEATANAAFSESEGVMGAGWRSAAPYENSIVIRHDSQDPIHDKGDGGTVVTTYAVYAHGRKQSIRDAFAARGVAPGNIIGSTVQRGQVIMQAGDTGASFHNHLHFDVSNSPSFNDTAYTLPVVFEETGQPSTLTFYTSKNEKVT